MTHRRSRVSGWHWVALLLLPVLALCGCNLQQYPQSTLTPHSEYARSIQTLLEQQVFWVVIIFVLVQGLLIVAVMRFRARPGLAEPKPIHGHTLLEIAWTIAPAIVLALVAVPTVLTIYKTQAAREPGSMLIKVVGHQWWWEFQYPELGVVTGSELHLPVGRPVYVDIETNDVLHSFWIPAMGGKRDAVPNRINHIAFTPDSVGVYPGQCAELCGLQHANMKMKLFVETPDAFDAWVAAQKLPPVEPDSGSAAFEGRKVFSESGCVACHTIDGISAGVIGPNLNHVGSRTTIAGSMAPMSEDHLAHWISAPDKMKPGTLMLNLGLQPAQVQAVVAYIMSLK